MMQYKMITFQLHAVFCAEFFGSGSAKSLRDPFRAGEIWIIGETDFLVTFQKFEKNY